MCDFETQKGALTKSTAMKKEKTFMPAELMPQCLVNFALIWWVFISEVSVSAEKKTGGTQYNNLLLILHKIILSLTDKHYF